MINQEIRNRIKLSVAAYAYEFVGDSIMSDHEYDELSRKINPKEKRILARYIKNLYMIGPKSSLADAHSVVSPFVKFIVL